MFLIRVRVIHKHRSFVIAALLSLFVGAWNTAAYAAPDASLRVQLVDQNGAAVRDAVIEVMPASGWTGPIRFSWPMAMAQRNQQFVPHTLIVAKGSTVAFPNLDQVRHSIYSFSKAARFTINLYGREQNRTHTFPIAGTVALGCNIHDQMRGYIRVVETPFAAKTDSKGMARLTGMPVGSATMTVWHPNLRAPDNVLARKLTLAADDNAQKLTVQLR